MARRQPGRPGRDLRGDGLQRDGPPVFVGGCGLLDESRLFVPRSGGQTGPKYTIYAHVAHVAHVLIPV